MNRDVAFCALALSVCGLLTWCFGALPLRAPVDASGLQMERARWWRLWLPLCPAALALALLAGWAWQEPARTDEIVRPLALLTSVSVALVWARAAWRAWRALGAAHRLAARTDAAVAVGLLRPRVVVGAAFRATIDDRALEAAVAHERAHVRHRDPLRLWLAQIATDLQWPAGAAGQRLGAWATALELARDEEARQQGVRGEDLASAIMSALRLRCGRGGSGSGAAACLTGQEGALLVRLRRLLAPLPAPPSGAPERARGLGLALLLAALLVAGATVGLTHGDAVVRALPIVGT
ncbi:MAG TPA: M56 family metallopeptidase [Polyangia bacterium]|nr:M56 family metallopeptidase [Polyangia bacterium]